MLASIQQRQQERRRGGYRQHVHAASHHPRRRAAPRAHRPRREARFVLPPPAAQAHPESNPASGSGCRSRSPRRTCTTRRSRDQDAGVQRVDQPSGCSHRRDDGDTVSDASRAASTLATTTSPGGREEGCDVDVQGRYGGCDRAAPNGSMGNIRRFSAKAFVPGELLSGA